MTLSLAAPVRVVPRTTAALPRVYAAALVFWLVTRLLVLVHQGAWPWMNAFVVEAARSIVVGDWNDAVRPQLPAVLGVPLVVAGATEQQTVAFLYLVASLIQFGAFVVLVRALFPGRLAEQTLALLVFLLVPYDHSIHHYRDVPVLLASAAVFLLSAHFVSHLTGTGRPDPRGAHHALALDHGDETRVLRSAPGKVAGAPGGVQTFTADGESPTHEWPQYDTEAVVETKARWRTDTASGKVLDLGLVAGVLLLGLWSRGEVLTFVGALVVLALILCRRRAVRLALTYSVVAIVISSGLLVVYEIENVNLAQAWFYTAHTFLDSTPDSWLSPECQANPTENCREADGLTYFGPADLHAGVLALAMNHPLTTVAKTLRSAWDNLWTLLGPNTSTFPGIVPFVVVALAFVQPARELYAKLPLAVWIVAAAVVAETVLPPLSWAPPHPQYHLQLVLPIVVLVVPILVALARLPRGRLVAVGFLVANAGLSAFRYTRYPGY
jgi:hypothetical protein